MAVNYTHPKLLNVDLRYRIIRDCLGGELDVKNRKEKYLPRPDACDVSPENTLRYGAYLERAVFYNVTKRTRDGLCGQIFTRDPVIEVLPNLEPIVEDASGGGISLIQSAKQAVNLNLAYGRGGLFVDYPATDGVITRQQLDAGSIRPTLKFYEPWRIKNWRTVQRGAREILSLVVLEEEVVVHSDDFSVVYYDQWRVLRLVDDVYTVEVYSSSSAEAVVAEMFTPTDASGKTLDEIPFSFFGAVNNDSVVDDPPMYDIAALNIAHYRNSADYEEAAFMAGQPTPVFSGLDQNWVENVMKGVVRLGSRAAVLLPEGGNAFMLAAPTNIVPFEAMQHKERQMVALGARLAEQRAVVRTASEAQIDHSMSTSVLTSVAKNVSTVITWGLRWAARFMGESNAQVIFELNTDFDIAAMTADDRRQLIAEWQGGAVTFGEMRSALRKAGIASKDDIEAEDTIANEMASLPALVALAPTPKVN